VQQTFQVHDILNSCCSFCYACCCIAFVTGFQIKQINSFFWRIFYYHI